MRGGKYRVRLKDRVKPIYPGASDYDEDEDGYFASKVNEAQPGKLPQTSTEKQNEDDANIIKRRKSLHNTNLVLACTRGQLDKVRTMLKHEDADVNFVEEINMFSPLHACVINGHFNVLQTLLKEKGGMQQALSPE